MEELQLTKRIIAIGGVPGTGKTTLMRSFIGKDIPELKQFRKLVTGHEFDEFIVLGNYSDSNAVFAGTDVFSMAVQPEAEEFFKETDKNVVYEGDRIFNGKMLSFLQNLGYDLLVIVIESPEEMLKERYTARGSDQSEKFLTGRKTKYDNIKNDGTLTVYTAKHETIDHTNDIADAMRDFIHSGIINTEVLTKLEHDSLGDFFS